MEPATSRTAPERMTPGSTVELAVRVLTHGVEVKAAQLSIAFDPRFLEVVDEAGNPAEQLRHHPNSPLSSFTVQNQVDNTNGTIRFVVGSVEAATGDFDLTIIRFKTKDDTTPAGSPTEVVFLVDNSSETAVATSGKLIMKNTEDFTGAFISINAS